VKVKRRVMCPNTLLTFLETETTSWMAAWLAIKTDYGYDPSDTWIQQGGASHTPTHADSKSAPTAFLVPAI
jgi:hypothetical protein